MYMFMCYYHLKIRHQSFPKPCRTFFTIITRFSNSKGSNMVGTLDAEKARVCQKLKLSFECILRSFPRFQRFIEIQDFSLEFCRDWLGFCSVPLHSTEGRATSRRDSHVNCRVYIYLHLARNEIFI